MQDDEKDRTNWSDFVGPHKHHRGSVWQLERCPQTEKLHLQGYTEYTRAIRLAGFKKHVGRLVHGEHRKGSQMQAIEYCRKRDSRVEGPWELGSFDRNPGRRTDLHDVAEAIQSGKMLSAIVDDHPVQYIKYRRGIESLYARQTLKSRIMWRDLSVHVYWGESGTGKTREALSGDPLDTYILDQGERVWFDGYCSQSILVIDDFYGWIKYGMLLRILDGHPYRAEIKGGFVYAAWTKVVITSNKPPEHWYTQGLTPALSRRINEIKEF